MQEKVKKRKFSFLRFIILVIIAFALIYALDTGINISNPTIEQAENFVSEKRTKDLDLTDRVKRAIFIRKEVNSKIDKKNFVKINEISRDLVHAIVAVEDNRFYSHYGFDTVAIGRAILVNLQRGQIEEGASTITQQLVKNLFLSSEQNFDRKLEELILAFDIEMTYSKEEILELYLNIVYFGSNFYGIHDASMGYFGKLPKDLTLEESAMLAGLPNAPSLYSPYVNLELAKKRQKIVLDAMEKYGYIINSTAEKAKIAPLYFMRK